MENNNYVLIADDVPSNRTVLETMLSHLGLGFVSVEDGQQAFDRIQRGPLPALIFMDCQMPVMDGYAATEKINEWQRSSGKPRIPIIGLTAGVFEGDRNHGLAVGMDDFLSKPLEPDELQAILKKWLPAGV